MINVVAFAPEHLSQIKLKEVYAREGVRKSVSPGSLTILHESQPIAIFGGFFIGDGNYQVWGLVSDGVKKSPIAFHKAVQLLISEWFARLSIRRMQMSVQCGYEEGWHWAKSLGFRSEGVMKKYAPDGSDCWLFARTL